MAEERILAARDEHVEAFARRWVNLADPRLGAEGLASSDEFFAPLSRMLSPQPAVFVPDKYDDHGKWMDGWETRRRRSGGHDHCVVKLAMPGRIRALDIDTSHFTGNYAPAARLEGCLCDGDPGEAAGWVELLPRVELGPSAHHVFELADAPVVSHLRLHIYPDGGVARLRVFGDPEVDWAKISKDEVVELSSVTLGGRIVAYNDAHYGDPLRILAPGRGVDMGDGWETRRRREPGYDWILIALGHAGEIERLEIDTAHYKGNFADRCSINAGHAPGADDKSIIPQSIFWPELMAPQKLQADSIHSFEGDALTKLGPVTHLRLNIYPDGGISRIRAFGRAV